MVNPSTNWTEPVFRGDFYLRPKVAFILGRSMGKFGIPSIWFDTLRIIRNQDTLEYNSKKEILNAFRLNEDGWFYLIVE